MKARIGHAGHQETTMAMTVLDKELVAVAVSVAAGCRPCATYHLAEARKAGATDSAIEKAVAEAVCVRTGATEEMRRHALNLNPQQDGCGCSSKESWEELAALGAALAVNSTQNIDKHLATARGRGIPQEELDEVFALTRTIRARAIQHGEARFGRLDTRAAEGACGCAPASAACG
jgi:AhpD family alkylhydroperoxidase